METTYTQRNPLPFLVLAGLVVLLGLGFVAISGHPVIYHPHAVEEHGAIARQVRVCLDSGNTTFQLPMSPKAQLFICELEPGKWGLQFTCKDETCKGLWHELTSFIKGRGTWNETIEYIARVMKITPEEVVSLLRK